MPAARYRKRPVSVTALQFKDGNTFEIVEFLRSYGIEFSVITDPNACKDEILITTLEGTMAAMSGDWIIIGIAGEAYPCKPEIFEASYEVDE